MVQVPRTRLRRIHRRLFCILNQLILPDYVHSGRRERSYVTNAAAHVGSRAIYKVDVRRFFDSVKWEDIYGFFHVTMACSPDVAALLADLCTVEGDDPKDRGQRHLPTGSPISQPLAYWCFSSMFEAVHRLAGSMGLTATVYVDDIAVSGPQVGVWVQRTIRSIVSRYSLEAHKERYWKHGKFALVTGAVVTCNGLRLPNSRRQEIWRNVRMLKSLAAPRRRIAHLSVLVGQLWAAVQLEPSWEKMAREFTVHLNALKRQFPHPVRRRRRKRRPLNSAALPGQSSPPGSKI